jgi:hypothetical protein
MTMPEMLTAPELASKLRLSVYRVRQLAKAGRIPSLQAVPRGKRLFDPAAVLEALRGTAGPAAPGQTATSGGPDR